MKKIYEVFGTDAFSMTVSLLESAEVEKIIPKKDAVIALKPNLIHDDIPENGAVTHPGVVAGCADYLKKRGFHNIEVVESSWVGANTQRSFVRSGMKKVCEDYGIPFYDLKKDATVVVETPFRPIRVCKRAYDADFLMDLPVLKGHCQTRMTCALKNLKGCIPDQEKRQFHSDGLTKPIAALAAVLHPDFTIVDSICGDLNFEEGGNPVQTNRMYAGCDAVNLDAYGCRLMGLSISDVGYLPLAAQWGAGELSLEDTEIIRLNEPVDSREYPKPTGKVAALTRRVHQNQACSACYASLVRALYLSQGKLADRGDIFIGQGFKGKALDGIGIGRCCENATVCVKGCPPTAEEILKCK